MLRPLEDALREQETMGDWRDGLNSQAEVMDHLLSNELFANATLIVGREKERLRVVKEILQSLSRPFEHRLATTVGAGAGGVEDERDEDGLPIFHFNDIELEPMKQLLKFAYTHEWSWSGEVKDFSAVLSFLHVVEKLGVKNLARKIQNAVDAFMATDNKDDDDDDGFVNVDTACQIFEGANSLKFENWKKSALQLILRSASLVFEKVENYKMLTSESLVEILEKNELAVESELALFEMVVKWAKEKCQNDGSVKNLQKILKDVLPCIRFTQMPLQDFLTHVEPSKLLGLAETSKIQNYFCVKLAGITSPSLSLPDDQEEEQCYRRGPRKYVKSLDPCVSVKNDNKGINVQAVRMEEFGQTEKYELLALIRSQEAKEWSRQSGSNFEKLLEVDIKSVSNSRNLMSFLERTASISSSNSIKISLTVDTIQSSSESPKSSIKFGQVTAIHFESLEQETQLLCLINIVQNSPNLRQLSIGPFAYGLGYSESSYGNMSKFLRMVSLRYLEFSCGLIGNCEFTKELFVQLKGNGVAVKKLGFNFNTNPQQSEIIDLIQGDLEEIHCLNHSNPMPTFHCCLNKLKILGIYCNFNTLLEVLKKTPNVQKIFVFSSSESSPVAEQISLPHLTSLSVCMCYKRDSEHLAKMFANCPNLSRLTCNNGGNASMAVIYEKFRHIKKFRYLEKGDVTTENVVGMAESALTNQFLNRMVPDRPPYIGLFEELTSLSFGYKDYQHPQMVADWRLGMKVFTHGIGHLKKVERLRLPPMSLEHAKKILTFLTSSPATSASSGMTQLKLLELQVWSGQDDDGTMTIADIQKLAKEHAHRLKIEAKNVRKGQNRHCIF